MELYSVTIPCNYGEKANLIFIGDIHWGEQGVHVDLLRQYMTWATEQDNPWFIMMGDSEEFARPSVRARLMASGLDDDVQLSMDRMIAREVDGLLEILSPMSERTLAVLEGHHSWRFMGGETTEMRIARELGAKYVGPMATIRVQLKPRKRTNNSAPAQVVILATHGSGGGVLRSGPINKIERFANGHEGVDIIAVGHSHRRFILDFARMRPIWSNRGGRHRQEDHLMWWMNTGTFLKGYYAGRKRHIGPEEAGEDVPIAGYAEKAMMTPNSLGGVAVGIQHRMTPGGIAEAVLTPQYIPV